MMVIIIIFVILIIVLCAFLKSLSSVSTVSFFLIYFRGTSCICSIDLLASYNPTLLAFMHVIRLQLAMSAIYG
jgi:hypothetical protein